MYSYHLFLISSASVRSLLFLSFIICPSLHEMFPWCLEFSWRDLWSSQFFPFPLFLCIVHLRRLCSLSLLFSGTLHSVRCIFPFLLCLLLPSDTFCLCLDLHTLSTIYFIFFQGKHPEQSFCLVASIQSIDICMRSMKRETYFFFFFLLFASSKEEWLLSNPYLCRTLLNGNSFFEMYYRCITILLKDFNFEISSI